MVDYLYDDTFEGFLTCVYLNYYEDKASGIYSEKSYQANLLNPFKVATTDETKATKVYDAIANKISSLDLKRVYKVFMSNGKEKENKILNYIKLGFKEGKKVGALHSNPVVFEVQQLEYKVNAEIHRLYGLVRFQVINPNNTQSIEVLYSKIEPDHDLVEFLANHFSDRFHREPFIIHDARRNKALIAKEGNWYVSEFTEKDLSEFTADVADFPKLWRLYFETIAIEERINPKCQKRCMPARYWKNLTEFNVPHQEASNR